MIYLESVLKVNFDFYQFFPLISVFRNKFVRMVTELYLSKEILGHIRAIIATGVLRHLDYLYSFKNQQLGRISQGWHFYIKKSTLL